MIRFLALYFISIVTLWYSLAGAEDQLLCRPNFDHGQISNSPYCVIILEGRGKLHYETQDFLASEIAIQVSKVESILGVKIDSSENCYLIRILEQEELTNLGGEESINALTIDGVMNFSPNTLKKDIIRHEVFHAMLFRLVGNKIPWWIEEGLSQMLSGELEHKNPKTKLERKYYQARLKVSDIARRCGFRAFGSYIELVEQGNRERYAFNKIFNEECTQ